eukprot:4170013-Amphidinium_carterae.1
MAWPATGAGKRKGGKGDHGMAGVPQGPVGAGGAAAVHPGKGRGAGEITHDGAKTYMDVPPSWGGADPD